MSIVRIDFVPSAERVTLSQNGIDESADGLSFGDDDTWEWRAGDGSMRAVNEKNDLLAFSVDSRLSTDVWYFTRMQMAGESHYVYLIDSSWIDGMYVICGIGGASKEEALRMLARAVTGDDWRIPGGIEIGSVIDISSGDIINVFKELDWYRSHPEDLAEALELCSIIKEAKN